ncbi:exodeoxyribonuclease VII large subunit [Tumebacillus permanentifrigoris]|uniref:Exodeoxyribonuclease 7 large subunit n=2 Tax=Tumebacillus permanentifrigoris TaxID=378543 RepID=A0A316DU15_9BACL|nr:exodeoxyribonuclease VII large subunit [Tumebacillus permanentifrigoris]PWK11513.1 exodeoxyribonuclease VII large subunit [Tumebacillus permanentifrigoris]
MIQPREIPTVSMLTMKIKQMFETNPGLQDCWVRGEISNFTHHSKGHMYFTLKDPNSRVKAIMFAGNNRYLKFIPKEGMKVIVHGYISVFERDGAYQLYVDDMQPEGLGSLFLALQQLKEKLEREGLFDAAHKKPLPSFPRVVGVITSPTGAAVRDIITTIRRRFPVANVLLHPVIVQGPQAAASVADAIRAMNEFGEIDVLIVGRGGGSFEELWAFNEEVVVRAIHASSIPVISAVGHETDTTLADFVADVRAATPTAAAELAVPHLQELRRHVEQLSTRMEKALQGRLREGRNRLQRLEASPLFTRPTHQLNQWRQVIDNQEDRLQLALTRLANQQNRRLSQLETRLLQTSPVERAKRLEQQLVYAVERLQRGMGRTVERDANKFDRLLDKLDAYSPLSVMRRGYSLVYTADQKRLIRSVQDVNPSDQVLVRVRDGWLDCQVWGLKEENTDDGND